MKRWWFPSIMSTYAFHFYCRGDPYRHSVGQKGICEESGSVLYLCFFACVLDFPGGCGGDLSLPAGIKRMGVLRAAGRLCSGMCSVACTVYPGGIHKEE